MNSFNLISAIVKGKWLVEPIFALSQGSVIASILNKSTIQLEKDSDLFTAFAVGPQNLAASSRISYRRDGFDKALPGSVAVVSIRGALLKEDQGCGHVGMATLGEMIKAADAHPNISGLVLSVDSPGGTVDGTETLANIVKGFSKPSVTFVDGLMASAALWIGSSTDETIASTDTDEIGSVGVLMSFMDIQAYYEKLGIKFHTITATASPEKVKMWEDLRSGNYDAYIKEILDPLDEKFMTTIRSNCPNVEDKHLTGKVFFARDVMGIFVNQIGTLDDAILRVAELADQNSNSNSNSNTISMKQFTKVNSALGVETLESVDDSISLNGEQIQLIESALDQVDVVTGELNTANQNVIAANAERDTAIQNLASSTNAFDEIDETIASATTPEEKASAVRVLLASKPGAKKDATITVDNIKTDADAEWETIDSLAHNQDID